MAYPAPGLGINRAGAPPDSITNPADFTRKFWLSEGFAPDCPIQSSSILRGGDVSTSTEQQVDSNTWGHVKFYGEALLLKDYPYFLYRIFTGLLNVLHKRKLHFGQSIFRRPLDGYSF